MVKAQEWLDENYPKEERSEIREIYLNEPSLEGELDLEDFGWWLREIHVSQVVDESKINFKNAQNDSEDEEEVQIIKCFNAQE